MDKYNDFLKIIQNKYDKVNLNADSIYDELVKKENTILKTINRVIDFEKNKENKKKFLHLSLSKIYKNIFFNLNKILEELLKTNKITIKQLKKIFLKEKRIIYLGILLIIIAIYLALIELSDSI
jgi:hypothetical protein